MFTAEAIDRLLELSAQAVECVEIGHLARDLEYAEASPFTTRDVKHRAARAFSQQPVVVSEHAATPSLS